MKYRYIPGTGLKVSEICLGTMTFGDQLSARDAVESVAYAHDQGVNFIDTADIYFRGNAGESERILSQAIKPIRDKIVLATKCGGPMSADINDTGLSRRHVMAAVDASLKRLDTDYVDILYYHFPDHVTGAEELIHTANDLIRAGKIRNYGISNFSAWQTLELQLKARQMNLVPPCVTETVYNLVTRGLEDEMLPMLKAHPMGLVTFNPLAGGLLTGKHKKNAAAAGSRFALDAGYAKRYFQDNNVEAVERLTALAEENGYTLIEMAMKWLLHSQAVTSVIVGYSRLEQLRQNLELVNRESENPLPLDGIDQVWKDLFLGNRFNYHY